MSKLFINESGNLTVRSAEVFEEIVKNWEVASDEAKRAAKNFRLEMDEKYGRNHDFITPY